MIHKTAIIETEEPLPDDAEVGPYAILQGRIVIGSGCRIGAHAQLLGSVTLGSGCTIGPGAILGGDPQDTSFDPAIRSRVVIGDRNRIREHTTVHRSAAPDGVTSIGNDNFLMAGTHIGHDCRIGDHNIFANTCLLGGHVTAGNRAFLGGGSAFHQHVRIGDLAMTQGNSAMSKDTPPYVIARRVNELAGINTVGLERAGLDPGTIREIRELYKLCFRSRLNLSQALEAAARHEWKSPEARFLLEFLSARSHKGVCSRRPASP